MKTAISMNKTIIIFSLFVSSIVLGQSSNSILIFDFVKIKNDNKEEALHYYNQNWKQFRIDAKKKGFIKSYDFIDSHDAVSQSDDYDFILITELEDIDQLKKIEDNFQKVMREVQPDGPSFLNDKRPSDFRESVLSFRASKTDENIDLKEDILKIAGNIVNFSKHYTSGDYNALASAYSEEGIILPPGADIIKGREAIKNRWILPEGVSVPYHKIAPLEINIVGNHAYDIGYYEGKTIRKDGSEVSWKGKYLIVWKKEDGKWKIYADAWNRIN